MRWPRPTNIPLLAQLPIDPELAQACDEGGLEDFQKDYLADTCKMITGFDKIIQPSKRAVRHTPDGPLAASVSRKLGRAFSGMQSPLRALDTLRPENENFTLFRGLRIAQ